MSGGLPAGMSKHLFDWYQEPITRSLQLPHVPVTAFFTDRTIFSLNLSRIQIPTGTSVANCNHKHGLMLTCRYDVDTFAWGRIVSSLPKRAHADWNWPISRGKISKNRLACKNAVALSYYGSCRLLVMGSCWYIILTSGRQRCIMHDLLRT